MAVSKNGSSYPDDSLEDDLFYLTEGEFLRVHGQTKAEAKLSGARLTAEDLALLREMKVKWANI